MKLMPKTNSTLLMLASLVIVSVALAQPPLPKRRSTCDPTTEYSQIISGSHKPSPEQAAAIRAEIARVEVVQDQAEQLLKEGHLSQAEETCYRALAIVPMALTFRLLGDIYRAQGRYKEALEVYLKMRPNFSDDGQLDLSIALSYFKMGDLKNARKFYDEKKHFSYGLDLPPGKREVFLAALPGTETAKTMEASILYAWGCMDSSHSDDEGVDYFKKALVLVPHNSLIAYKCGSDLAGFSRKAEAVPYWARAAVFGKGFIAEESLIDLHNYLMPDKVEQALNEARKIK